MKPRKVEFTLIQSEIELSILTVSLFIKFNDIESAQKETISIIEKISDYLFLYNMKDLIIDIVKECILKHRMEISLLDFIKQQVNFRLIK
ncbi:hypothetical protein UA32_12070 [Photobacterium angustum]|uniref:Uncharacterized protein n=1 Tax=Photobacterium angustum TaxID=661 RepID=A0ABX5GZE8_PHOAN|nr:hypothetical protein [Photobacterium angustum]KJG37693.1 hypothetical protein UA32_12070 [Photobacterium angustum]PSX03975.1 hypothetical protein C0W27_21005 [Photobacterium angustum]